MNLVLTEDQQLLASSVESVLAKEHDFQARRRSAATDEALWPLFAEMGWLGQPLAERWGGFGGGALATGLLQYGLGRQLVAQPFHACVVLAARLLEELGTDAQRQAFLPGTVEGSMRLALAHDEAVFESPWAAPSTAARRVDGGWLLEGSKLLAIGAPGADALLVSASVVGPEPGLRVFLVPPSAAGMAVQPCTTADGLPAADLTLTGVRLDGHALVGGDADASGLLHRVLAEGVVASCWDACGAMTAAYEQTVGYTRQRVQFGKALAEFQVVAHRLAEMAVCCTEARAACELASLRLERGDGDAITLAAQVKGKVGRCADAVAKESVQLHGAIGTTEELPIAACFRRLAAFNARGGSPEAHARIHGQRQLAGGRWRDSATLPRAEVQA